MIHPAKQVTNLKVERYNETFVGNTYWHRGK